MKKYIKGALNYTGGKYKLLPHIEELLPKGEIGTLVDLFCGGLNVALNVEADVKQCNDIEAHVIDLYQNLQKMENGVEARARILGIVKKYDLSKENREGFEECRAEYNRNKKWDYFYATLSHAFNYQIRYNLSGNYNMPFGKNRSHFNPTLQKRFTTFVDEIIQGKYEFTNKDFREVDFSKLNDRDFVYCDPPYLASTVVYGTENAWTEEDEKDLLDLLDDLNNRGIKFMLSNVIENKGKSNDILKEWSKKYNIFVIDGHNYSNSSYQSKDKGTNSTIEVIITNY